MIASRSATDIVRRFEGCVLFAYPDPGSGGDPWTIGYGATGPGIHKGVSWTQEQAEARLASGIAETAEKVSAIIKDAPTTQGQFDALVSLAFNIGARALAASTLIRMHIGGDFEGAAAQFARWNKASGKVLRGLVSRRAAEAALYAGECE